MTSPKDVLQAIKAIKLLLYGHNGTILRSCKKDTITFNVFELMCEVLQHSKVLKNNFYKCTSSLLCSNGKKSFVRHMVRIIP